MYQLAQLNVARAREDVGDAVMAEFVALLDEVYAEAESAPGYVWRLRAEDVGRPGFFASVPADPRLFVTVSVWESVEALRGYVYGGGHRAALGRRAEWFEPADGPSTVLWWVKAGTRPRPEQGLARLKYLRLHGPTPTAFTFAQTFPPPEEVK